MSATVAERDPVTVERQGRYSDADLSRPSSLEMRSDPFVKVLNALDPFRSRDASRPVLCGYMVERCADDAVRIAATDSYRLAVVRIEHANEYPIEWVNWPAGEHAVIDLNPQRLAGATQATRRRRRSTLGNLHLTVGDRGSATLDQNLQWNGQGVVASGLSDVEIAPVFGERVDQWEVGNVVDPLGPAPSPHPGEFPNVDGILRGTSSEFDLADDETIAFNPTYLAQVSAAIHKFATDYTPVRFTGQSAGKMLYAWTTASGPSMRFDAMLMSVRVS